VFPKLFLIPRASQRMRTGAAASLVGTGVSAAAVDGVGCGLAAWVASDIGTGS